MKLVLGLFLLVIGSEPIAAINTKLSIDELIKGSLPSVYDSKLFWQGELYSVEFSPEKKVPRWVSYVLDQSELESEGVNSESEFSKPHFPAQMLTQKNDWLGHHEKRAILLSRPQIWSKHKPYQMEAMHPSMLVPMWPEFYEKGQWARLAHHELNWVKIYKKMVVITGPVFDQASRKLSPYSQVMVPTSYFKIVLIPYPGDVRVSAFLLPHLKKALSTSELKTVTVSQIERLTGIEFFSGLPLSLAKQLKQQKDPLSLHRLKQKLYKDKY